MKTSARYRLLNLQSQPITRVVIDDGVRSGFDEEESGPDEFREEEERDVGGDKIQNDYAYTL